MHEAMFAAVQRVRARSTTSSREIPMLRRILAVLVAAPLFAVAASAQTATTVCKDGTTSATTGRGACTGHGGVDKSAAKKAATAAKAERKAERKAEQSAASKAPMAPAAATVAAAPKPAAAAVTCSDGSSSKAGRGACARHGGVKLAAAMPAPSAAPARPAPTVAAPTRPAPSAAPTRPAPSAAASMRPAPAARPAAPTTATTHAANTDPAGATAQCKDGTYSHAASHRGACARHQGVAKWL